MNRKAIITAIESFLEFGEKTYTTGYYRGYYSKADWAAHTLREHLQDLKDEEASAKNEETKISDENSYGVSLVCGNCGHRFTGRFPKGARVPLSETVCPCCGCSGAHRTWHILIPDHPKKWGL